MTTDTPEGIRQTRLSLMRKNPRYYARVFGDTLTQEELGVMSDKLGKYEARSIAHQLGIDADYTPGIDDGEEPANYQENA